jgi:hypothetical protein
VPEAYLDLEPVPAGRQDVTQLLADACGSEDDPDAGRSSRREVDVQSSAGDRAAEAADGLMGGVQEGADQRLAEAQRADPFLAVVAQDELAAAVVAGFEDRLVDLDAQLEPVEGLLLRLSRRRPGGRPRTGGPAAREPKAPTRNSTALP